MVLTSVGDSFISFNEQQGSKTLVKLMGHEDPEVVSSAVTTLGVASKNESVVGSFKDLGIIQNMTQLLFMTDNTMIIRVLKTLCLISRQESMHSEMIKYGVIDTVLKGIITTTQSLEVKQQGFMLCSLLAVQGKHDQGQPTDS